MHPVLPHRLPGAGRVEVVAPALSRAIIGEETRRIAERRLADLGLRVTFGAHVDEVDRFLSSPIESRVEDLHRAFADPAVDGILTVIGGFNANQLLPYLDWELIGANPKVFCGFSDITALSLAMLRHCDLVTYSGPHYASFGMLHHGELTASWFRDCTFGGEEIALYPSPQWFDDRWFEDQERRVARAGEGWWVLDDGEAEGRLVGGNLCTMNLLQGTGHMPDLAGALVFVEDDEDSKAATFDRDLESLVQQPGFAEVTGLLIGRFQVGSEIDRETLTAIVRAKAPLRHIPVVANIDFGHTEPMTTLPVGGTGRVVTDGSGGATIVISRH